MRKLLLMGLTILVCTQTSNAQHATVSISEPYGKHTVGFKVINTFDKARSFLPAGTADQSTPGKTISRPIQTCIWYPAKDNGKKNMKYEQYFFLIASETGQTNLDNDKKKEVIANFLNTEPVDETILRDALHTTMKAKQDAPHQDLQKFPVIIYGPSWWSTAFENALLFEFLASHGYIVLSSPSVGPERREMPISRIGVETQARDMEFLLSMAHDIPNADVNHIAVAGFSLGGLSNVLMMARNTSVDAWIGIDPSIHEAYEFFKDSPYEDYSRFSKPMLFINSLGYMNDLPFYDKLVYSDSYMVNLPFLEHTDLASKFIRLFGSKDTKENVAKKVKGYNIMVKYILAFLDGVFNHNWNYQQMSTLAFNKDDLDDTFVEIKSKEGIPNSKGLLQKLNTQNAFNLIEFLNTTVSTDGTSNYPKADLQELIFMLDQNQFPEISKALMRWYLTHYDDAFGADVLAHLHFDKMYPMFLKIYLHNKRCDFHYDEINHTGHVLSMSENGKQAIPYFILNTQLHPENYKAFFNLGIGYYRSNDFQSAIINFEECLALQPDEKYKNLANDFIKRSKDNTD